MGLFALGRQLKWGIMKNTRRSKEERNSESNVDYDSPSQDFSEKKNINEWPRNHSFDIFPKMDDGFHPCSKNLPEVKLKSVGSMAIVDVILK